MNKLLTSAGAASTLRSLGPAIVCAALVIACATVQPKPLPPQVSLNSLRITRVEPSDTRLGIELMARNPNHYDLAVNELEATLAVNDERLLTGRLTQPAVLKAAAETRIEIEVRTDFVALATALERVTHEGGVRYDINGYATLQDGLRVPFARTGEMPAADFLRQRP